MAGNKQVKSKKRVKAYGEVFTNEKEVKAMCDLIPADIWENIEATFLEPSCGNGNFLAEIFKRKLDNCKDWQEGLKALKSIYGIDILQDNVEESRKRLIKMYVDRFGVSIEALFIVRENIICGDSLEIMRQWEYR